MTHVNTFKPGDRFQHYWVEALIGSGFHGEVYAIRHMHTGDRFALKVLHLASRGEARRVARALAEAKGTYGIQHKNVVQVFDLNCEPDGMVWMRMELLRGHTIERLLAMQGRLSLLWAVSAGIHVAWGLHAAHERGIIHRDVKPANLFYADPRTLKVIDFSIAKIFPEGLDTTTGRAGMGTPAYMAPEQLEGAARPDVRFDIYGLGISMMEMITGKNPWFDVLNNTAELMRRQMQVMPPPLAETMRLPRRVDEVIVRAIAKDPSRRYTSMMEMGRALYELRAWLLDEARARRLVLRRRMGEPACPGDADMERVYSAPEPTPVHPLPAPAPSARVIVSEPDAEVDRPSDVANTLPLRKPGNFGGTVPLDGAPRTDRGTDLLPPPAPTVRRSRPAWRPAPPASLAAVRSSSEPAASAHAVAAARRRMPWGVVAVAVLLASVASVAIVWWLVAVRAVPGAPTAPPLASASAPREAPAPHTASRSSAHSSTKGP